LFTMMHISSSIHSMSNRSTKAGFDREMIIFAYIPWLLNRFIKSEVKPIDLINSVKADKSFR